MCLHIFDVRKRTFDRWETDGDAFDNDLTM